jgi:precorrin-6y C5,15-methyltransferase (decarboxylating) CbiE subunit
MAVNKIAIVGCGPGSRGCVTLEALAEVESAETIIGTAHLLELFPEIKAERIVTSGYRQGTIDALQQHEGKRVALLVTGDPGLASLSSAVIEHFGLSSCRVLPGISSVQAAYARVGLSWEGARIVSAHATQPTYDASTLANENSIAVLTGNAASLQWIASLARTLGEKWRFVVAQDLTLSSERVFECGVDELEKLPVPLRAVVLLLRKGKA